MDADDERSFFPPSPPPPCFSPFGESETTTALPPPSATPFQPPPSFLLPLSMASDQPPISPLLKSNYFQSQIEFKPSIDIQIGGGSAAGEGFPQPLESLSDNPVPPCLSKTFDFVEESSLDAIISWGKQGASFIIWNPVDFARMILPRNFKHSNFSSFVRQLNTYGFHKIDTDKWEFANEGFVRGQKHLLKTIQRRKSSPSHKIGSSCNETDKAMMEGEIESLRKERNLMMQEVVELQHQHRGTVLRVEEFDEKLQASEKRQKQMVSFLAKVFQNPAFLARLQNKREQEGITSSRTIRKFVRHQMHESGVSGSSCEGHIVKYHPKLPSSTLDSAPATPGLFTGYGLQGMENDPVFDIELATFTSENNAQEDIALVQELLHSPEKYPVVSTIDPNMKAEGVLNTQPPPPHYFVSFPEELMVDGSAPEFPIPGSESMVAQDVWSMGFKPGAGMGASAGLWDNLNNYDHEQESATDRDLSDIWDVGSLQLGGISGIDQWLDEESLSNMPDNQGTVA